jgi:hypothetical protein
MERGLCPAHRCSRTLQTPAHRALTPQHHRLTHGSLTRYLSGRWTKMTIPALDYGCDLDLITLLGAFPYGHRALRAD